MILGGEWWKVGVFQGRAVYSKDLGDGVPYKVLCWYDADEGDSGAWMFTSSKVVQFSSGWETKQLAKAVVKNYIYDFMNMDWEVLWPDSSVQVMMVPLSVVQKLSNAAAEASAAGSSSDGGGDV